MEINVGLIEQAKKNRILIDRINQEHEKSSDELRDSHNDKCSAIRDEIYALEKKVRDIDSIKDKLDSDNRNKCDDLLRPLYEPLTVLKRIFQFMELKKRKRDNFSVLENKYSYEKVDSYKPVVTLIDSALIVIKLYIVGNNRRKKVNKVGLWAIGSSLFHHDIVNLPYEYGCPARTSGANIVYCLKDFKTKEDAMVFIGKHKGTILKDFIAKHKEAEQDYRDVLANCNTKEWKIAFLEHKKKYYERSVSNGIDLPEYKEIIKKLKELSK